MGRCAARFGRGVTSLQAGGLAPVCPKLSVGGRWVVLSALRKGRALPAAAPMAAAAALGLLLSCAAVRSGLGGVGGELLALVRDHGCQATAYLDQAPEDTTIVSARCVLHSVASRGNCAPFGLHSSS